MMDLADLSTMPNTTDDKWPNRTVQDQIYLAIFSLLLLSTILMAVVMKIYNSRNIPDNQINVLVFIYSHLIDTIPFINLAFILPTFYRLTIGTISQIIAEFVAMGILTLVGHFSIILVASSSLKLLLVANFGLVFCQDPHWLARNIFIGAACAAFLPNLIFTVWLLSVHKCSCSPAVAYLIGSSETNVVMNYSGIYILMCVLLSIILLLTVKLGVPVFLQRTHTSSAIRYWKTCYTHFLSLFISQ